jgi:hypothetical protein
VSTCSLPSFARLGQPRAAVPTRASVPVPPRNLILHNCRHHPPLAIVPQGAGHPQGSEMQYSATPQSTSACRLRQKASPKSADEHLNSAYRKSVVHTCVPQPCLEFLPWYFSCRAGCWRLSSRQLRRRRRRRMRRPMNNQQIRTRRLRVMNRRTQLRYSSLRHNRRQASPGNNRQPLPKLARVRKRRHGRFSMPLALGTERLVGSRRSVFWG